MKDIFRISADNSPDSLDQFTDYLEAQGIFDKVRFEDGIIRIHRTLNPDALGAWLPWLYYLAQDESNDSNES